MSRRVESADVLVRGGPVHTMDGARRVADYVAIADGVVAAAGRATEIDDWVGPRTRVIDAAGGVVLPAFQDAHIHPIGAGLNQLQCDLHDASGAGEYLDLIAAYARAHPERDWIVGGGWAMDSFAGGTPSAGALDEIVSDRPVFLMNRDWHSAWVNSRALEVAGIDRDTPDRDGGRIERDERGGPSGTLHEHAADLVDRLAPRPTAEELRQGLVLAQQQLLALGITGWQDASVSEPELDTYVTLAEQGMLTARVTLSLLWDRDKDESQLDDLAEHRERGTFGKLSASTVKIFQDGVVETFTAAMLLPYLDASGAPTGNSGMSMIEPEALNRYVTILDANGFQVHFHAIGDRAVRECLDAVEAARDRNGTRDARHHIAHLQVVHPDDIARFKTLEVVANCQPLWACMEPQMSDLTIPFLGPERSQWQYPFGSLIRAGATVAFGSDWSVSSPNPLLEMEVAVTRVDPAARAADPFIPSERVSAGDAVAAFTNGSSFVNNSDIDVGSIEPGKAADVVVLDRNIFEPGAGPIGDAEVLFTLAGGDVVYERA